jgi:uncharacterized protein YfiM (DUF2279 family)
VNLLLPFLLLAADTGGVTVREPVTIEIRQTPDRWLGEDKPKHFAMSYMITAGSFGAARVFADRDESVLIGAALGLAAGIVKEIHDPQTSVRDLVWDAAGIAAAVLVTRNAR